MLPANQTQLRQSVEKRESALKELKTDEDFIFFLQENQIRHAALMVQQSIHCPFQHAKDIAADLQKELIDGLLCS